MVAELAPLAERAVCTEIPAAALAGHGRPGARSRPGRRAGRRPAPPPGSIAEPEPDFEAALLRASALAAAPPEGALLVAGSHYAIAPARAVLGTAAARG